MPFSALFNRSFIVHIKKWYFKNFLILDVFMCSLLFCVRKKYAYARKEVRRSKGLVTSDVCVGGIEERQIVISCLRNPRREKERTQTGIKY
jgi:hypothetical protein